MNRRALVIAAAAAFVAAPAGAQSWRTVTAARQARATDSMRVDIDYGLGRLTLGLAPAGLLYDLRMRYDEQRAEPVRAFDEASSKLTVGVRQLERGSAIWSGRRGHGGELALTMAAGVLLDLSLDIGATASRIDLAGLSVRSLRVRAGASETRLAFGAPNPVPLRDLSIEVAAAELDVRQLGNANAERVSVRCAVGDVELDLSGAWARDMHLELDLVLGSVTLRVPRDIGVRVRLNKVLASFDHPALVRRGDDYVSANFDAAPRKLTIEASTVLGSLDVLWLDR
ncbi:MAG: cell wall-active antibiotics response protein [Gemmatimonadota bacterium]|nr:cell wall-active antibiotics response protein [Gemmatimonadota bacterium]